MLVSQRWLTQMTDRMLGLVHKTPHALDGLLVLLVTDLADFTSLVERLGDRRTQRIIQRHNRALRACIEAQQGSEVAHTGDGLIAAFRSVARALACARAMQVELAEQRRAGDEALLHARIGLHLGEPLPEEGRLFGHCVNVAVRVCARAAADRVLVSQVVKQLAPPQLEFGPGRHCMLKGVTTPLCLYEFFWQEAETRSVASITSLRHPRLLPAYAGQASDNSPVGVGRR